MRSNRQVNSLANQLIWFMFLLLFATLTASTLITRYFVYKVMFTSTKDAITSLANEKKYLIDNNLSKVMILGRNLRQIKQDGILNLSEDKSYIENLLRDNRELESVCVATSPEINDYRTIYHLDADSLKVINITGTDYQYKDWFQIPFLTDKEYWTEPWYDEIGSQKMVNSYCLPIRDRGRITGIIRMDLALQALRDIVLPVRVTKNGYAFLVSNNGTIVTHPADSLIMNYSIFNLAEEYDDQKLRSIGKDMIAAKEGFQELEGDSYFSKHWLYYTPLPSNRWSIVIVMDDNELFADLNYLLLIQIIITFAAFALTAFGIYARTWALNMPLKHLTEAATKIGSGDFDSPLPESSKVYEIQALTDSFAKMQVSLKDYIQNLKLMTEEKNKIFSEVLFASTIQRNLIPSNLAPKQTLEGISAYGILEPAGEIGGDLYDYFMIDEFHFCFGIADVMGKGIVAAMTMTMATTLIRTVAPYYEQPDQILRELNRFLVETNLESSILTIILGIIDLRTGKLCFSNSGHVPLYLRSGNRNVAKFDQTHSTALGVFDNIEIGNQCLQLNPGDEIILFTDGITEAMSSKEVFFGTERLEDVIRTLQNPHPETTAKAILNGVQKFSDLERYHDDITILVLEFMHPVRHQPLQS
jgi:sigma-B regulation protein RsbU (phosphoserine phosphatase)